MAEETDVDSNFETAARSPGPLEVSVRETSRLKVLNRFAIDLIAIPTEPELFWYVAREVVGNLGFIDCVIYLADPRRRMLRQVAAIGAKNPDADNILNVLEIPIGEGITGHVARTREPLIVDDLSEDRRYIHDLVAARSEICVPLLIGDELVGVIDSEDPRPDRFDREDLDVLMTVAAMTCAKLSLLRKDAALQESQSRFQAITEAVTVPVIITRWNDGSVLYVNPAFQDITGIEPKLMFGQTATEYWIEGADKETYLRELEESRGVSGFEIRLRNPKSGNLRWTILSSQRITFEGEDAVISTFQDVTDRREAEDALRISEERLRESAKLAQLGHWVWDAIADRCLFCSDVAARIHGLTPEAYIDRASIIDGEFLLVHEEDRDRIHENFRALRNGHEIDIEYRVETPDGDVKYVREMARPIFDGSGRVYQEHGTVLDITDLKHSEERLHQAQRLEAVGKLTGGVAHDFNNLLAVVQGNAELLKRDSGENDSVLLDAILRASARGSELTQRLLAFSRRQPLQPVPTDVAALVSGMRNLLSRTMAETIRLEISDDGQPSWAMIDPGQMESALLNLAINAQHAMPQGGTLWMETSHETLGEAFLRHHPEVKPGRYVKVTVCDRGVGIPHGDLEHVFEPFFTTKDVGEGSGLGLSMVYGFVKQSDGYVTIDSTVGEGTAVHLLIPSAERAAEDDAAVVEQDTVGGAQRILVVEDDPDVRKVTVRMLENLGYRVVGVEAGPAALSRMEDGDPFDLMLSDVVMPGMSGVELAGQAKRHQSDLEVLLMSGYADSILKDHNLPSGVHILEKPFTMLDLSMRIRALLQD